MADTPEIPKETPEVSNTGGITGIEGTNEAEISPENDMEEGETLTESESQEDITQEKVEHIVEDRKDDGLEQAEEDMEPTEYENEILEDGKKFGIPLEEYERIQEEMMSATKEYLKYIDYIMNLPNKDAEIPKTEEKEPKEELLEEMDPEGTNSEELTQVEEGADKEEKWFNEEIDPETEEFLVNNGEEQLTGELSPEELRIYEELKQMILDRFPAVGTTSSLGTLNTMLEELPQEERDRGKEAIKIMLRIAIRLPRIVSFVADEIVKSADKDDKTTRFIFGSIRDATKSMEEMADTAITGDEHPERLTKTMRDFLFEKDNN